MELSGIGNSPQGSIPFSKFIKFPCPLSFLRSTFPARPTVVCIWYMRTFFPGTICPHLSFFLRTNLGFSDLGFSAFHPHIRPFLWRGLGFSVIHPRIGLFLWRNLCFFVCMGLKPAHQAHFTPVFVPGGA